MFVLQGLMSVGGTSNPKLSMAIRIKEARVMCPLYCCTGQNIVMWCLMLLLLQVLVLQATAKIQNTGVHSVAPENIHTPTMEGFLI